MYQLSVKGHFDAAHYLKGYPGICSRLHGHRWEYELIIQDKKLDDLGMLIDFAKIKAMMKETVEAEFDHTCINESKYFQNINPTAENLSKVIYDELNGTNATTKDFHVIKVTIWESPECSATYWE